MMNNISNLNSYENLDKDYLNQLITESNFIELEKFIINIPHSLKADFILYLSVEDRNILLQNLLNKIELYFLSYIEDQYIKEDIINFITIDRCFKIIVDYEIDDIISIISDIDENIAKDIINLFNNNKKHILNKILLYPKSSIGRIMNHDYIAINENWSVKKAFNFIKKMNLEKDIFYLIIVNDNNQIIADISISKLITRDDNMIIKNLVNEENYIYKMSPYEDQEDALKLFRKYDLKYIAITDDNNKLIGIIDSIDIIDIIEEENSDDMLYLSKVSNDVNLYSSSFRNSIRKIPWLFGSLVTTSIAAIIIYIFAKEIEKSVILAVLLPIIASVTGNSATQSVAIIVRSIANGDIVNIKFSKMVGKDLLSSLFTSTIISITIFISINLLNIILNFYNINFTNYNIIAIFSLSLFLSIMIGNIFALLIPIFLHKIKFDPAISSPVFVIAITDASSFLIFLSFAKFILS